VDELERQRALRRMKAVATALLAVAAVIFLVARSFHGDPGVWGYVEAGAEAAMVGALADWFAVTALFRHPLGLPIPHTAIIPQRKDQIGRSLGQFVEGNFMSREIIGERLRGAGVGRRFGDWLAEPANATRAADAVADAMNSTLRVLDDREVEAGLERMIESRIRATDVAPLLGRAIDLAMEGGHHERLFDSVLVSVKGFMEDNRDTFRARLDHESPWWVPEPIDDRIFNKIYTGVHSFLGDVAADPNHEIRHTVTERAAAFAARLKTDPTLAAKGEELKEELLAHPDMRAWMASVWRESKRGLLDATATPGSELRQRMSSTLQRLGVRLQSEPELQERVDASIERFVMYVVDNYRSEVSSLIESTIAKWDGPSTARTLELQVGRDLQFIRINGTIVGCLAGLGIHAISQLL
jgi:uncharacterized membrane-anchored protein YjiN (DUF445 family)